MNLKVFELSTLAPLKGETEPFCEQVKVLTRPYIKLSVEQFKTLK